MDNVRVSYFCASCKFNDDSHVSPTCYTCNKGSKYSPAELRRRDPISYENRKPIRIKSVIFNDPATIVIWSDNTKTVVKAKGETFDKEKGLAMAIAKKSFGNKGNYYGIFKKWIEEEQNND